MESMKTEAMEKATKRAPLEEIRVMTVDEVAALLRVSPKTIYNMVERGELRCVRVGRGLRFDGAVVTDLLQGNIEAARSRRS
jgi:excisionase family DNA binding protein